MPLSITDVTYLFTIHNANISFVMDKLYTFRAIIKLIINFLATAQFEVVPKKQNVQGVRNGSLNLEWDMINIPAGESIVAANLYINETNDASLDPQNVISTWDFVNKKPMPTKGKDLFPGRFSVSYKPDTYTMTLKNLQYNDTGSFLLNVAVGITLTATSANDNAVITISQINGEYGFFIHLCCASMTSGDELSMVTTKQ